MIEIFGLREHNKKTKKDKDYIALRDGDILYINIPVKEIQKALEEFEKDEQITVNY